MELVTLNLSVGKGKREVREGREVIVCPAVLLQSQVLAGSQGPLYYPPEEIARNYQAWNGIPLTLYHPQGDMGQNSASDPGVWEKQGLGWVEAPTNNGKLRAMAVFDVERTKLADRRHGTNVLSRLERGMPIELSTGLNTTNVPQDGIHNGRPYVAVATRYRPDHLAVLPDQKGACSLDDGCGILMNEEHDEEISFDVDNTFGPEARAAAALSRKAHKASETARKTGHPKDHGTAANLHQQAADAASEEHAAGNGEQWKKKSEEHVKLMYAHDKKASTKNGLVENGGPGSGPHPGGGGSAKEKSTKAYAASQVADKTNTAEHHQAAADAHSEAGTSHAEEDPSLRPAGGQVRGMAREHAKLAVMHHAKAEHIRGDAAYKAKTQNQLGGGKDGCTTGDWGTRKGPVGSTENEDACECGMCDKCATVDNGGTGSGQYTRTVTKADKRAVSQAAGFGHTGGTHVNEPLPKRKESKADKLAKANAKRLGLTNSADPYCDCGEVCEKCRVDNAWSQAARQAAKAARESSEAADEASADISRGENHYDKHVSGIAGRAAEKGMEATTKEEHAASAESHREAASEHDNLSDTHIAHTRAADAHLMAAKAHEKVAKLVTNAWSEPARQAASAARKSVKHEAGKLTDYHAAHEEHADAALKLADVAAKYGQGKASRGELKAAHAKVKAAKQKVATAKDAHMGAAKKTSAMVGNLTSGMGVGRDVDDLSRAARFSYMGEELCKCGSKSTKNGDVCKKCGKKMKTTANAFSQEARQAAIVARRANKKGGDEEHLDRLSKAAHAATSAASGHGEPGKHRTAASAHRAASQAHAAAGNKSAAKQHAYMAKQHEEAEKKHASRHFATNARRTLMNRNQMIETLVANHEEEEQEAKTEVYNGLSNLELATLVTANAKEPDDDDDDDDDEDEDETPKKKTKNAATDDPDLDEDDDDDEVEVDNEEIPVPKKKGKPITNAAEWFDSVQAPPEIVNAWNIAQAAERQQRSVVINHLTGHLEGKEKKEAIADYKAMDLPTLQKLARRMPKATQNSRRRAALPSQQDPDYEPLFVSPPAWVGNQGGPSYGTNDRGVEDGVIEEEITENEGDKDAERFGENVSQGLVQAIKRGTVGTR